MFSEAAMQEIISKVKARKGSLAYTGILNVSSLSSNAILPECV